MIKKYAYFFSIGIIGLLVLLSVLGMIVSAMDRPSEETDDTVTITPVDSPKINLRVYDVSTGQREIVQMPEIFAWSTTNDSDPHQNYIGKFSHGDTIEQVYAGGGVSMALNSNRYYSATSGGYRGNINLPAKAVSVGDDTRRLSYNVLKIASSPELNVVAENTLGTELESSEEDHLNYVTDNSSEIWVKLQHDGGGQYHPGAFMVRSFGNADVEVQEIRNPDGTSLNFSDGGIHETDVKFGNKTYEDYRYYEWKPTKLVDQTLSVKLKVQSDNTSTEEESGVALTFRDYDHHATISGVTYDHSFQGEDLGYDENIVQPIDKNTGLTIGVN